MGTVTTTYEDGGLENGVIDEDRMHAVIGVAETGDPNKGYLVSNVTQAHAIFTKGPLVDSISQYFEEFDETETPHPLVAIRATNDLPGSVDPFVFTGTGLAADPAVTGTPTGNRTVIVRFVTGGACGVAEYRISRDGGISFDTTQLTPPSGDPIYLDAGISAAWTDYSIPADTFHAGDEKHFVLHGPSASESMILDAVESVKNLKREKRPSWVHVAHPVQKPFAVACESLGVQLASAEHQMPLYFVLESENYETVMGAATPVDDDSVGDYFQSISDHWDDFVSPSGQVVIVSDQGRYIPGGIELAGGYTALEGTTLGEWRNAATFLCHCRASGPVSESPAWVKKHRSRTFSEIRFDQNNHSDWVTSLTASGHVMLTEYPDYEGVYLASGKMKSRHDSDFQFVYNRARVDKADRIVYRVSIPFIEADENNIDLDTIKLECEKAVKEKMLSPGAVEIADFKIRFDRKKFEKTGAIDARLEIKPGQHVKSIGWTMTLKN